MENSNRVCRLDQQSSWQCHQCELGDENVNIIEECNACPFCEGCECCSNTEISLSDSDHSRIEKRRKSNASKNAYTLCQVRRHNTRESAWLVAGDRIYDATNYISYHPGGERSILRYAGGVKDCTEDMNFHSKNGIKLWKKFEIGILVSCPGKDVCESFETNEGCVIC